MSEHEQVCNLLADLIQEQARTTEAITTLAEALAGVRTKVEAGKAIDKAKAELKVEVKVEKPKAEATTTAPAAEPKADPVQAEIPTAAPAATYQDAATAITKLSRTKGRDAAVALLAKFGAAKLPDVKPEQFADVIAAANEAMGA